MESSVVVKVKYGDKLRRFNATVKDNRTLELDIEGLRAKIRSLFNFAADSELELTYEDEDQDIVALVDEEDLHDVLKQDLDPVRITVQINTGSSTAVRSSGTSTPLPGQPDIHSGVADLLKTVPEPFRGHLVKLSSEVASRTASSTPILAELIESIRHSFLNTQIPPRTSADNVAAANKEASESLNEPGKVVSASGNEREGAQSNFEKAMRNYSNMSCTYKKAEKLPLGHTKDLPKLINFNETPMYKVDIGSSSAKAPAVEADKKPFGRTKEEAMRNSIECPFSGLHMPPSGVYAKPNAFGSQSSVFHRGVQCDGCGVHPITGPRFKSKVKENYDLCHICFEQMGKDSEYTRIDVPALYRHPWSFKGNPHVFHPRHWAQAPPPPPPMFGKHMKQCRPKLDSRFILDVNIMDGTIMAPKTPFTKIWRMRNNGNLPWIHGTQLVWIGGDKFSPTNSVEIEIPASGFYPENEVDVAVDFIAPELPGRYISYWKMASASGQKFGQRIWVLVQVDASLSEATTTTLPNSLNLNLPPEGTADNLPEMLDIPIEPLNMVEQLKQLQDAQPLANMGQSQQPLEDTHDAQLAGQQWFLLSEEQNKQRLSTKLTSRSLPEMPDTPLANMDDFHSPEEAQLPDLLHEPRNMLQRGELLAAAARKQQLDVLSQLGNNPNVPLWGRLVDQELMGLSSASSSSAPLLPTTELGLIQPPPAAPLAPVDTNSQVEEVLLKELEQMGFKQVEMNKTVLRKNDYDFEKSLDELCNVSEWDLLLEEMRGMGFVDGEANKRVLAKNNGSLKHAVMDLITRENV